MLNSTDERGSEGIRISNPRGSGPATVRRIVVSEAIKAPPSLSRVELRGILSAGDAPSVGLFGYPAFVTDVGVTVGGVQRCDNPPRFRRCAIGHCQPRARVPMVIDVFGRRFNAHIRQPGALKVETGQLGAGHLEGARDPVAFNSLPQFSGLFAPSVRVVKDLASRRLRSPTRFIGGINNTRIRFQAVARSHNGNYAIIP
jgi:hypothetical protein